MRKTMISRRVAAWVKALVAVAALASAGSQAEAVTVKDFDLFVDTPTGFVFVKLPAAWKFVGRVDDEALKRLPGGVHTSLLEPSADDASASVPVTCKPL